MKKQIHFCIIYDRRELMTITEIQDSDLGQSHIDKERGEFKHVYWRQILPINSDDKKYIFVCVLSSSI